MNSTQKLPINRADDGELLGYVVQDGAGWQAQTIFGHTFARSSDQAPVEQAVREQGLKVLTGVWSYLDNDDKQWHSCIIRQANPTQVTVVRTNEMGYEDTESYKLVVIKNPDDTKLVKN